MRPMPARACGRAPKARETRLLTTVGMIRLKRGVASAIFMSHSSCKHPTHSSGKHGILFYSTAMYKVRSIRTLFQQFVLIAFCPIGLSAKAEKGGLCGHVY